MIRWSALWLIVMTFLLSGCDPATYEEIETGYKGPARVNPWLAADRFLSSYGRTVETLSAWREPKADEAIWIVPADVISNDTFAKQLDEWMENGGHVVCLVDNTTPHDDWRRYNPETRVEPAFERFLEGRGFKLEKSGTHSYGGTTPAVAPVSFRSRSYQVSAESSWQVSKPGGKPGVFASSRVGDGILTVLTDARPFRNRWIGDSQHAVLLKALAEASGRTGNIVFIRGAALSLTTLLLERAWAVLLGVAVLLVFWLWKNMPRFGPSEAAEAPSPLRGYDHHLEALGDFQWRLDKGAAMLGPMREEILERSHRLMARFGRLDDDIFALIGERAGIPRERVFRALAEPAPADASVFTRTVADLQQILKILA